MNTEKVKRLNEIDFMRPLIIIMLVVMHSFSIYTGGSGSWPYPEGIMPVTAYKWVQIVSYGCMLEAFTFISGYLFGFQLKNKPVKFSKLLKSKAIRLLIPSFVFSLLYIVLFSWNNIIFSVRWGVNTLYSIICGYAHLWYLPMLFWCFLLTWCINRIKVKEEIKLGIIYTISLFVVIPFLLQINTTFQYLPFFYLGVYLYKKPIENASLKNAVLYILLFLVILFPVSFYRSTHPTLLTWQKVLFWYLKQLYASFGTIGLFVFCKLIANRKESFPLLLQFNACCFGIYVLHQFVLKYLYYYSLLPSWCGTYLLPWCGFLVAFFVSLGLTWFFRRYKFGRFLFG